MERRYQTEKQGFHSSFNSEVVSQGTNSTEVKPKILQVSPEEIFEKKADYIIDRDYRLHYFASDGQEKILLPLEPITDPDLILGVMGNSELKPRNLEIRPRDREKIRVTKPKTSETEVIELPGKSAIIMLEQEGIGILELINRVARKLMGRASNKRDHLYCASVSQIMSAGWIPYWAPLQWEGKTLHARLVAKRTLELGEDPLEEDTKALVQVFQSLLAHS